MIEIEKKFEATEEEIKRIIEGAEFLGESVNRDTYYDRNGFPLIKNNMTLRERNGKFELKVFTEESGGGIAQHHEFTEDDEIKVKLGIPADKNIKDYLRENEYIPFGSWVTERKKYKKEGFTIDIDSVDFGHNVLEIELQADNEKDAREAAEKILVFAEKFGLEIKYIHGKAMEYIRRTDPASFEEIKLAWANKTVLSS